MKYYAIQRVATWVENFYELEIDDEDLDPKDPSHPDFEEQFREAFHSGDYKYLGHTQCDDVAHLLIDEEFHAELTDVIVNPAGD
jgi:hypothetical protein